MQYRLFHTQTTLIGSFVTSANRPSRVVFAKSLHHGDTEARRKANHFMLIEEELTESIIGAAIEVHRELGPGLLESAYEECLCHELHLCDLAFQRQTDLPVTYKGLK